MASINFRDLPDDARSLIADVCNDATRVSLAWACCFRDTNWLPPLPKAYALCTCMGAPPDRAVEGTIRLGHHSCVEKLIDTSTLSPVMLRIAAGAGQTETLLRLHEAFGSWVYGITLAAAVNGHTDTMLAAVAAGCPWDEDIVDAAALSDHLLTALAALSRGQSCRFDIIALRAADRGLTTVAVKFLQMYRYNHASQQGAWKLENDAAYKAALQGHTKTMLRILDEIPDEHREVFRTTGAAAAAGNGHTETMLAAFKAGAVKDSGPVWRAAHNNHLETMLAALDAGCPMHQNAIYMHLRYPQITEAICNRLEEVPLDAVCNAATYCSDSTTMLLMASYCIPKGERWPICIVQSAAAGVNCDLQLQKILDAAEHTFLGTPWPESVMRSLQMRYCDLATVLGVGRATYGDCSDWPPWTIEKVANRCVGAAMAVDLHRHGVPWPEDLTSTLKDSYVIDILLQHGCPLSPRTTLHAAYRDDMCTIRVALKHGGAWHPGTTYAAAYKGHTGLMLACVQLGCPWHPDTMYVAALRGRTETMLAAHEEGCPWDQETTSAAALNGHTCTLRAAAAAGCPVHPRACYAAALNGHTKTMHVAVRLYADQHGGKKWWHPETTYAAAANGHLLTLRSAIARGCPWDPRAAQAAADNGHTAVSEYINAQGL